jgi:hypothetical protein
MIVSWRKALSVKNLRRGGPAGFDVNAYSVKTCVNLTRL